MDNVEWSDWIVHDGTPKPHFKGVYMWIEWEDYDGEIQSRPGIVFNEICFDWNYFGKLSENGKYCSKVLKYRFRVSKQYHMLEELISVPEPQKLLEYHV